MGKVSEGGEGRTEIMCFEVVPKKLGVPQGVTEDTLKSIASRCITARLSPFHTGPALSCVVPRTLYAEVYTLR